MFRFIINSLLLVILLLTLSGFGTVQSLAKENSISDSIDSQTSDLCRTLLKGLSKLQLTEKDRVNRIEQALVEIESGRCSYCPNVVRRLLEKNDLKEGSRLKGRVDSLMKHKNSCAAGLLPYFINHFDYNLPLEELDSFSKSKRYDISKKNAYMISEMSWKKELIYATLYSNNGSNEASRYVVDILSLFANAETLLEHVDLVKVVVQCNPLDEDVVTAILSQSIYMRKKSSELTMGGGDQIFPNYQSGLNLLNTVVEWNKYKDDNFKQVNYGRRGRTFSSPIDWNWEEDGTIDFLNQLLVNGFTVIDDK